MSFRDFSYCQIWDIIATSVGSMLWDKNSVMEKSFLASFSQKYLNISDKMETRNKKAFFSWIFFFHSLTGENWEHAGTNEKILHKELKK